TTTLIIFIMKNSNNPESIPGINKEIERQKALKALEKAKSLNRKVVFLAKGASGNLNPNNLF
ncbi:hypothetical protein ACQKCN_20895, partial [Chryseobacterium scophthalmum]